MGGTITIGEDCWIAGQVIILPGVTIGKGSTVGAGSVVTKVSSLTYPPGSTMSSSTKSLVKRMCLHIMLWLEIRPEF